MLTTTPGFWCECWMQVAGEELVLAGCCGVRYAAEADGWLTRVLRAHAPSFTTPPFERPRPHLYDGRVQTRRALLRGEACTVTPTQASTRVTWTIRPIALLPLVTEPGEECTEQTPERKPLPER